VNYIFKLFLLLIIFTQIINATELNLTQEEKEWVKNNPTIKVQSMEDSTPYNFIQDGKPSGYALANVQLIASKAGLKVEMVQGNSWNESMELLKNGKIDIMPNMVKTKPREQHYAFTSAYTPIMNVMYVKEGDFHPKSLDDLNGKTLGVAKGFSEVPLLQKHYPNIKLHFTKNGTEAFKLLSLGKVDATSYSLGAGNKIILKNALLNVVPAFEIKEEIFQKYLHMATNKKNKILRDILQKGLDSRTTEEKNELRAKWLLNQLNQTKTNSTEFTIEEKQWIKNNPKVKVFITQEYVPFSFTKDDISMGHDFDLLKILEEKTGLQFILEHKKWTEGLKDFKNKRVDIITGFSFNKSRSEYTLFTDPYFQTKYIANLYSRKNLKSSTRINDLQGKKVGILKDVFFQEQLEKDHGLSFIELGTVRDLVKELSDGNLDFVINDVTTFSNVITELNIKNLKAIKEIKLKNTTSADNRIGVRKDKPILHSILQKGLKSLTAYEKAYLKNKWLLPLFEIENTKQDTLISLTKKEKEFIKNNPTIKVHNELNWPPYNYSQDAKPMGYSIDIMNLIAKKTGINVEFVTGPTWNEFLGMMKDKSLDVMLNIVKTPERQKYLLYTPPYADNPNVIISKKDTPYSNIESLFGKTVAIPKGFFTQEILEKNYPQVKLLLVKNTLESMKAVTFGKADAALGELAVINHLLTEHMMTDLTVSGEAKMGDPEYSLLNIATRKDLPVLQSILTKGVETITVEEKRELQKKWLGNTQKKTKDIVSFSDKEKSYLASKSTIKMCVDPDWLPFEKIDEKGDYKGIGSDIIEIVSSKINKPIDLVPTSSWADTMKNFKDKNCDILPIASNTPSRQKYMQFTKPYITKSLVIATKEDQFFIQDSSELLGKKIGIVKGYSFIELLKQKQPDIDIVTVKNTAQGLEKVQSGELFGFVDALPVIAYIIQRDGMLDLKIAGRLEFDVELSIATQIDQPLLNSIMQKALDDIESEQINSIVGKWISIKIEQSFDYKILLYIVAVFLIVIAFILYRHYTVAKMNKELEKISITDALTNIYNRRYFNEVFPKVINSAKRKDELVSFLIMDIDHFKQYNDTYGHQMGDDVLTKVSGAIKNSLHRADDYCFRLGGEEFGIVFKADTKEKAFEFANKVRQNIEDLKIEHSGNSASSYITASMGLICKNAKLINDEDEVYKQGDDLLYKAKEGGRNRVESL
jgi:polar amino acid transport system substrate-binding protein